MSMVHFIINTGDKKFAVQLIVLHPLHSDRQSYFRGCFKTKPISSTVVDRIKRLGNPSSICASSSRLKSAQATPGDARLRSNMSLNARSTKSRDGHSK